MFRLAILKHQAYLKEYTHVSLMFRQKHTKSHKVLKKVCSHKDVFKFVCGATKHFKTFCVFLSKQKIDYSFR